MFSKTQNQIFFDFEIFENPETRGTLNRTVFKNPKPEVF
jgi:hypothetical protein